MYQAFFGLSAPPFELNHDPRFVVATPRQSAALRLLEDGLTAGRPLTVLLGHPGLGKTTILRTALASEACQSIQFVYLPNPTLGIGTLVETLFAELQPGTAPLRPELPALRALLLERRSRGVRTALVIDESENLTPDVLTELAALMGLEAGGTPLLPIVLAGLPALKPILDRSKLQRWMTAMPPFELTRMDLVQTASYILSRVRAAGADGGSLFTREAVALIHERARGVPRMISVICDNALATGAYRQQKPVRRDIVEDVCTRLDLDVPAASPQPHELPRRSAAV